MFAKILVAKFLFAYVITNDIIQRWWTLRDTCVSTKDLILGAIIDTLKHDRASKVINLLTKNCFICFVQEICS